jgi:thiol-disulfide isomerase/thioredoxin
MALTPSSMLPLGTKAPAFKLLDVLSQKTLSLHDVRSDTATVILFICNHCPYVKHIQQKLTEVAKKYQAKGMSFIAINSNDVKNYPADSPDNTPDLYVFDKDLACVYRGRFDESTPGNNKPVTGKDLCDALDNILAGKPVDPDQKPSVGCNIKWKK